MLNGLVMAMIHFDSDRAVGLGCKAGPALLQVREGAVGRTTSRLHFSIFARLPVWSENSDSTLSVTRELVLWF